MTLVWLHLRPDWMPEIRREHLKGFVGCVPTHARPHARATCGRLYADMETVVTTYARSLAGVYDIPTHYEFESMRGVEELSGMGRALCTWRLHAWHTALQALVSSAS